MNKIYIIHYYNDRHLRRELRNYLKHIRCKVALVLDNFTLEIMKHANTNKEIEVIDEKQYYSLSKPVPQPVNENENEQPAVSVSFNDSVFSSESSELGKSGLLSPQEGFSLNRKKDYSGLKKIVYLNISRYRVSCCECLLDVMKFHR